MADRTTHETGELLPASFLTSVRYYWRETAPLTSGWPLFRSTFTEQGMSVEPSSRFSLLFGGFRITVRWEELMRIERTQRGIRLIFRDGRRPVVVATLWKPERLVRVIQDQCPVEFDPTLRRSTWSTV